MKKIFYSFFLLACSFDLRSADYGGIKNASLYYSTNNRIETISGYYVETITFGVPIKRIVKKSPEFVHYIDNGSHSILRRKKSQRVTSNTPYPNAPETNTTKNSCPKVDLLPKMGTIRDQISFNCYAYAAMEVLSFDQKKPYSPVHLTTLNSEKSDADASKDILRSVDGFDGGYSNQAMKLGLQTGLCPESLAQSEDFFSEDYGKILKYYMEKKRNQKLLEEECKSHLSYFETFMNFEEEFRAEMEKNKSHYELWKTSEIKIPLRNAFPKISLDNIEKIFNQSSSPTTFLRALTAEACKGSLEKIPKGKGPGNVKSRNINVLVDGSVCVFDDDRMALLGDVNRVLNNGKPISIEFRTAGLLYAGNPSEHGSHAAVIAGRRWVDGTPGACVYSVKNSWGSDWRVPAGAKAKNGPSPGTFDMTEKQLMEHVYGTAYVE